MEPQLQETAQAFVQAVMAACRQARAANQEPALVAGLLRAGTGLGAAVCQALYAPNPQEARAAWEAAQESCGSCRQLLEQLRAAGGPESPEAEALCGELSRLLKGTQQA